MQPMLVREPGVGCDGIEELQAPRRSVRHGCRDGLIQSDQRVIRHPGEEVV